MSNNFFITLLFVTASLSTAASQRGYNQTSAPNVPNATDKALLSHAVVTTEGNQLTELVPPSWPDVLDDCNAITLEMCEQNSHHQTAIWDIVCYNDTSSIVFGSRIRLCSLECSADGNALKCENFCPGKLLCIRFYFVNLALLILTKAMCLKHCI